MKSQIDFTLLFDNTKGYAVHCSNEEEAELFVQCVKELYPEMCKAWDDGETYYSMYGSETIYTFFVRVGAAWKKSQLMYGAASLSTNHTIIEFSEIYTMPELEESEMPLDMLFR